MWLILPETDLAALRVRVEAQFGIRLAGHYSEMRGGSYLRWPRTRRTLAERLNPWAKAETPPFTQLLLFRNGEVDDPDDEPFVAGWSTDCIIAELAGLTGEDAVAWFEAETGAVRARG